MHFAVGVERFVLSEHFQELNFVDFCFSFLFLIADFLEFCHVFEVILFFVADFE